MDLTLLSAGALFNVDKVDVAPLIATITSNAPVIIGAGIAVILVKKAVPLVPQLINKIIK